MARALRLDFAGAVWHLHSRGNGRQDIFLCDDDRERFLQLLEEAVRRFGWLVFEYELMTNHYHLVIETPQPTLSRGMQWLNGTYAQWFNRTHHRDGHLFQGRFMGHLIEKQSSLLTVCRYVALNAVRAQIVKRPEDYQWGSHRANAGLEPAAWWLARTQLLEQFAPVPEVAQAYYRAFVAQKLGDPESIWKQTSGQIYLGGESWIAEMRKRVESSTRSDDHPRPQREIGRPTISTIVSSVAKALSISPAELQKPGRSVGRQITAWLGCYEGLLRRRTIAAGLRLRSCGRVSDLIRTCDRELDTNPLLRATIDRCCDLLRRSPPLPASASTASPAVLR